MLWTKQRPTARGYYWRRIPKSFLKGNPPMLVYVTCYPNGPLLVTYHGTDTEDRLAEVKGGEWCGPIEPPRKPSA